MVLTSRRVALAAAEACWEGLLGLPPVKKMEVSMRSLLIPLSRDRAQKSRWGHFFRDSHTLGVRLGGRHCRWSES